MDQFTIQPENNSTESPKGHKIQFHRLSFGPRLRWFLITLTILSSLGLGIGSGIFITYLDEIPLVADLKAYKPSLSTKIYDHKGKLITELFSEQRTLIHIDDIPKNLEQAILAIEDNNFYQHSGIEISGIVRSVLVNFLHQGYKQGASTITQQLARNMFLTRKKTIERKIKEIILAFQIEWTYSKREILEMYFNQIYFGNGAHGIEAASQVYFGKHVTQLNLPECALLAGLPRSPNTYNPYRNPQRSQERRNLVLTQMEKLGFLSSADATAAKTSPIQLAQEKTYDAPYFVEYVRQQLEDRYGSNTIYQTGLKVITTLDLDLQRLAQSAMDEGILQAEALIQPRMRVFPGHKPETVQCALVVLDHATGEIKAMIGGRDFFTSKFNRAVQAKRQPGSAFKPVIYSTALANGFTQADVILDTPVVFNFGSSVWKPENFSNKFRGPTTLRTALTYSRNVVSVKLLNKIGVSNVVAMAKKLGIKSPLNPQLSLALGTSEVTLLELTTAFGVFPNHGVGIEPYGIVRVENYQGETLEENISFQQEVMDPSVAAVMVNLLNNVVNQGTAAVIRQLGFKPDAGGKTGTTNDYSDAWFVGFTSEYTAGVWLGLDSHSSMGRGITGGMVAAPIWAKLMMQIYANRAPNKFTNPPTVESVQFCNTSGLLPNRGCSSHVVSGLFIIGTSPTQHCDIHTDPLSGVDATSGYNLNLSPDMVEVESNSNSASDSEDDEANAATRMDDDLPSADTSTESTPVPALKPTPANSPNNDRPPIL